MCLMRAWGRAVTVPVVAIALWLLASCSPESDVVRITGTAETAALADAAPTTVSEPVPVTVEVTVDAVDPSSTAPLEAPVIDEPTLADTTTTSSSTSTSTSTAASTTSSSAPEPAPATTTAAPEASNAPLSLGQQALRRVAYPWRSQFPEWEIVFRGPRSGIRALTYPEEQRVEIFIRPSDTAASLHRVFAHELGHVIDVELNSSADRDRWMAQRGIPSSAPWWPSAESPDFATGAGDFAEAFAVWETGVTTRSSVGRQPTAEDLALLRELSQG